MSSLEEFRTQFENLNMKVADRVLEKCVELCATYSLDPEDFIDEWLAFSASKLNGAAPSLDALNQMERKELKKQGKSAVSTPKIQRVVDEPTPVKKTPVRQNLQRMYPESPAPMQIEENVPSESWDKRSDAGVVLEKYGKCDSDTFKQCYRGALTIIIKNKDIQNSQYMYEKFLSKQAALNAMYKFVVCDILEHYDMEPTQESLKQYSGEMVICGRIISDTFGRMEQGSIYMEGILDLYQGQRVKLVINLLEKVTLFSGQAVVVVGNNMKEWFRVDKIFTGCPLPPLECPPQLSETLQLIIAAGPFTLQNNLSYEPLDSLLKYVLENRPNFLILMGPFLEDSHPKVKTMNELYDKFFEDIIDGIMRRLHGTGVQVVLVPSHKDIHNHCIFPSLPYKLKKKYEDLYLAPNPFILDIEGVRIGGSTADVLFHLGRTEFSRGPRGERIGNLVSHIFNQRSFYPLYPSDPDISVDYQLLEQFGMIENRLHLMILPSNFKYFVKTIENCVVLNPERITKGNFAGTFARVEIRPVSPHDTINDRISCQIFRI